MPIPIDESAAATLISRLRLQERALGRFAWLYGLVGLAATALWTRSAPARTGWVADVVIAGIALLFLAAFLITAARVRQVRMPVGLGLHGRPPGFSAADRPTLYAGAVFLLCLAGTAGQATEYGAAAGMAALAALIIARPRRVTLHHDRLSVRRLRRVDIAWSWLTGVVWTPEYPRELHLALTRPDGREDVLRVRVDPLEVEPGFLAYLIEHYRTVPHDRTAIGTSAELARRLAAYPSAA
ncbi:hypothetical protein Cs7R123_70910 [Catellatospora sp. TT07R-123]|uniref:hypothetical protein n=1 Tax=Catellatospora sp. TT07R-123 TaxID=2733863 RepID=UPI001B115FE4|nr:hypothetical protein [Catellatospora sp. TT07R-123]GHJ49749.1 hypothetical protein Cs7R123_70910 [Catellatospora sp. TT07R-123]